jgi:hypothetical protein
MNVLIEKYRSPCRGFLSIGSFIEKREKEAYFVAFCGALID